MKGRCVLGPGQQQALVSLGPIRCNPANTGVGWPYPARAAVHFRNVPFLPGWTAAAHLYGVIGFGEKLFQCLWHSGTNTPATDELYDCYIRVESLYQGQVQGHYLHNTVQFSEHSRDKIRSLCFIELWIAKYKLHITLDIDRWGVQVLLWCPSALTSKSADWSLLMPHRATLHVFEWGCVCVLTLPQYFSKSNVLKYSSCGFEIVVRFYSPSGQVNSHTHTHSCFLLYEPYAMRGKQS